MQNASRKYFVHLFTSLLFLSIAGCGETKGGTLSNLAKHFQKQGIDAQYEHDNGLVGAVDGGIFRGNGIFVQVYLFEDERLAESLRRHSDGELVRRNSDVLQTKSLRNGLVVLLAYESTEELLTAFKTFPAK